MGFLFYRNKFIKKLSVYFKSSAEYLLFLGVTDLHLLSSNSGLFLFELIIRYGYISCKNATKDINEKLGVEKLSLNVFGIDKVPDQLQVNELIRRFNHDSINQLENIHHNIFMENSNLGYSHERVVVDFREGLL